TMPSLPTTAISADAPFSITYSSETIAVVGKYTWVNVAPDSYTTWERGSSTDSRCGIQRSLTEVGSADNKKFFPRSRKSMIAASLATRRRVIPLCHHSAQRMILSALCGSVQTQIGQRRVT